MYKYRVSIDDVKPAAAAKSDIGFANMDIRFLIEPAAARLSLNKKRDAVCKEIDAILNKMKSDGFVKSLFTGHCEERSDEAIS